MKLKDIAEYFGVNVRTVQTWKSKGCPTDDIEQVAEWRSAQPGVGRPKSKVRADYEEARRRKTLAQAELAEAELAKLRSQYAPRADIEAAYRECCDYVRGHVAALPGQVAPRLLGLDVPGMEWILRTAVNDLLSMLAKGLPDDKPATGGSAS